MKYLAAVIVFVLVAAWLALCAASPTWASVTFLAVVLVLAAACSRIKAGG
jgi:hypothetical protein